ncbi:hypothetical protein MICAG_3230008 [Microcystis aeruginosa PCC 9808]|uniref:Uncharacterized protein n=1 Tax=Microcystis aeruginosa PCC 9808 TaxID=1160284 RepID=I4HXJ5_MICAE|nr:hypothetical protein MICAG_3230008 [Microcystis aeruginosa PCC 9808]CCI33390.1 hypothetical protein MICAI_3230010 [Microcystis sp. T1-4]
MRHIFPLRGIWEGDILCFKRISESALLIYVNKKVSDSSQQLTTQTRTLRFNNESAIAP